MDAWHYFNPRKNRAFGYCDTTIVLAWKGGCLVGRIFGSINRRHNEKTQARTARCALLETTDDQDVAHALLTYVEEWARSKGMTKLVVPFGFNDQDPESCGKETDYVVYRTPRGRPHLQTAIAWLHPHSAGGSRTKHLAFGGVAGKRLPSTAPGR